MNPADFPPQVRALTDEQWAAALGGRRARWLFTKADQEAWKAHSRFCLSCERVSDLKGETGRRGFCLAHKFMVSNAFPVLCQKWASGSKE